jgi:hypothetical protein
LGELEDGSVTNEDIRSEIDKEPFVPFRLHLVSGNTVDVPNSSSAFMLKNAVMVFHKQPTDPESTPYDIIAMRNIERLEQRPAGGEHAS